MARTAQFAIRSFVARLSRKNKLGVRSFSIVKELFGTQVMAQTAQFAIRSFVAQLSRRNKLGVSCFAFWLSLHLSSGEIL